MNLRVVRIASGILSVFLLIYVGFQIFSGSRSNYTTQAVYVQSVTQTVSVDGIFFRDETVIPVEASGVVSSYYPVGTKVAVRTALGCVYQSDAALRNQYRLNDLQNAKNALQKAESSASASDVVKPEVLNGQASDCVSRIISSRDKEDLSGLSDLKAELLEVMARRALVLSETTDYSARTDALSQQIDSLQSQAEGGMQEFSSTASGYYVDHVDGWEGTLNADHREAMTVADVEKFTADYEGDETDQSSVKIVTNHDWQFVFTLSEQELQSTSGSRTMTLQFPGLSDPVKMKVLSTDRDAESGRYKVTLQGDTVSAYLLNARVQTAEILVTTYNGLKIPKEALRFPDNQMGVYVLLGDKMYFRKVDVIYETTDYVLSRTYYKGDSDGAEFVKLYDTIIVKGKDLYDQKLLR